MYIDIMTGEEVKVNEKQFDFYIDMAYMFASKSKDEGSKVGCVVTDSNYVVITSGYNGPNRDADDKYFNFTRTVKKQMLMKRYEHLGLESHEVSVDKNSFMIHAEMNALVNCSNRNNMKDSIVFVTHYCCTTCLNTLIQAGVKKIVVADNKHSAFVQTLPSLLFLLEKSRKNHTPFFLVQKKENS